MFSKTSYTASFNKSKSCKKGKQQFNIIYTQHKTGTHKKKKENIVIFLNKNTFHYQLCIIRSNNSNAYKVKTIATKQIAKTNKNKNTLSFLKINQIKCMSFGMYILAYKGVSEATENGSKTHTQTHT